MKKKLRKRIVNHSIAWTFAYLGLWFIRVFGSEDPNATLLSTYQWMIVILFAGVFTGIGNGIYEHFYVRKNIYKTPLGKLLLFISIRHIVFMSTLFVLIGFIIHNYLDTEQSLNNYYYQLFTKDGLVFIIYTFLAGFLIAFITEIDRKIGPGNLLKLLMGKFYKPQEGVRVFMFLDLQSSTTIAEKLGHIKYSAFIQDCFRDLTVVEKTDAEIYQYVGDEAVLNWDLEAMQYNGNAIQAFTKYCKQLEKRKEYYHKTYGLHPVFKAGIHVGPVMVAEVGEIKRDIAFHGDTLNTAARIQGMCNDLKQLLLVSDDYIKLLKNQSDYKIDFQGEITLRGKEKAMPVFSITTPFA